MSARAPVTEEAHLEKFIRSLQVSFESNIVDQSLMVIERRLLLDGIRFLAFAWRLGRLARRLG